MSVPRYEMETTITFLNSESVAEVYTSDPVWMRKLDKLVDSKDECVCTRVDKSDGEVCGKFYTIPKKYAKISPPRQMTEEQKIAAGERMRKMHNERLDG